MIEGKRKRGIPAARWLDDIKKLTGMNITNATRIAADQR
jgi:hypothetical protein